MNQDLYDALQIKYIKLYFILTFTTSGTLPMYKESALRGGLGEMMLRANCIKDRKCKYCEYNGECIVRRTMYSHYKIQPPFVTSGDSIGYVIYCADYRTKASMGDQIQFELVLFGDCLVYFNQYIQALFALGMNGIGKSKMKFTIETIQNSNHEDILQGQNIFMEYYQPRRIYDYVAERADSFEYTDAILNFITPLTLKYQGQFLRQFDMNAILIAIKRRIYMMNCYIGNDAEAWYREELENIPEIMNQCVRKREVSRYSSTQETRMTLKGIVGTVNLDSVEEDILYLLLAGELIHIGKNTSFGFGRYRLNSR